MQNWNVKRFIGERVNPTSRKKELVVEWEETNESAYSVRKNCPSLYEAYKNATKHDFKILGLIDDPCEQKDDVRFAIEFMESGKVIAMTLSRLRRSHKNKLMDFLEERARYIPDKDLNCYKKEVV